MKLIVAPMPAANPALRWTSRRIAGDIQITPRNEGANIAAIKLKIHKARIPSIAPRSIALAKRKRKVGLIKVFILCDKRSYKLSDKRNISISYKIPNLAYQQMSEYMRLFKQTCCAKASTGPRCTRHRFSKCKSSRLLSQTILTGLPVTNIKFGV